MARPKAEQLELALGPYDNRKLFSDHFLEDRLPSWPEFAAVESQRVLDDLATLLDQERAGLPSANEAQTEERFIKPILERLGFAFTVQAGVGTAGARRQPDYALFVDDADRAAAARQSGRRALPPRRRGLREDQPLRFLGNLRAGTNCWRTCRLRVTLCQKRRSHFANDGYAPSTAETVSKTSPVCAA